MIRTHWVSQIAVAASLSCMPCLGVPVAAQTPSSIHPEQPSHQAGVFTPVLSVTGSRFTLKEPIASLVPVTSTATNVVADRGWGRDHWNRNEGARTAIIVGSIAAIAGGALLVYANRPECGVNHLAGGCSYGTKVAGGAVLAGGVLGITVGALTWR